MSESENNMSDSENDSIYELEDLEEVSVSESSSDEESECFETECIEPELAPSPKRKKKSPEHEKKKSPKRKKTASPQCDNNDSEPEPELLEKQKPRYSQQFCTKWLADPNFKEWLKKNIETGAAFCTYCNKSMTPKRSVLTAHQTSVSHEKAMKDPVLVVKSKEMMEEFIGYKLKDDDVRMNEAKVTLHVAEHSSILTVDHLSELFISIYPKIGIKLKRTKCSKIIENVWEPYFQRKLIEDIGENPYSLILDESTDINTHKMLGIVIRYVSTYTTEIVTTYLSLVRIKDGTANSIVEAVDKLVSKLNLKKKNCVGLGTDNASVMVGVNNGVHKKLEELWNTRLVLMRCVCHSIQLAISSAVSELPSNLDFLIKETYNWFSNSTARQEAYEETYNIFYADTRLKLVQLSNTRWLSRYNAITRIISQWEVLKAHFKTVRLNEKNYTVQLLQQMYEDDINYCYLLYLKYVLEDVDKVNRLFESNKNPLKLLDDLLTLVESIGKNMVQSNLRHRLNIFETEDLTSYLEPNMNLGYTCEQKLTTLKAKYKDKKEGEAVVNGIRNRCQKFTLSLLKELKSRVPDNYKILRMMTELSPDQVLRQVKPKITELLKLDELHSNLTDAEIDRIERQWENIVYVKWSTEIKTSKDPCEFWQAVSKYEDASGENPFSDLIAFAWKIICLPLSNADVERVFSAMNQVKNKKTNRMKLPLLNGILRIRFSLKQMKETCFSFQIPVEVAMKIGTSDIYQSNESNDEGTEYEEEQFDDDVFEYFIRF